MSDSSARSLAHYVGRQYHVQRAATPLPAEDVVGDLLLPAEASVAAVNEDVGINQYGHAGTARRVSILALGLLVALRGTRGLAAAPFLQRTTLAA